MSSNWTALAYSSLYCGIKLFDKNPQTYQLLKKRPLLCLYCLSLSLYIYIIENTKKNIRADCGNTFLSDFLAHQWGPCSVAPVLGPDSRGTLYILSSFDDTLARLRDFWVNALHVYEQPLGLMQPGHLHYRQVNAYQSVDRISQVDRISWFYETQRKHRRKNSRIDKTHIFYVKPNSC